MPPHAQQSGKSLKEEALYPRGHGVVSGRGTVVDVDDKDGDNDGESDEDHDKEQVFSNQWDHLETYVMGTASVEQLALMFET